MTPLPVVVASGHVMAASETPLASVPVAVAVRKGAAKPDIATAAAVKHMLLGARSVSFRDGARALLAYFASPEVADIYRALGMVPGA